LVFVLVALVLSAADPFPAILTIRNRSGEDVFVQLTGDEGNYFFTVPSGDTTAFEVERDVYDASVTACGETVNGTIDLETNVRLAFPDCYKQYRLLERSLTAAFGEPKVEKVNVVTPISDITTFRILVDPTTGIVYSFPHAALEWWYFQY
jgi:hypothetical protein